MQEGERIKTGREETERKREVKGVKGNELLAKEKKGREYREGMVECMEEGSGWGDVRPERRKQGRKNKGRKEKEYEERG